MLLILEITAGIVLGVLVLVYLAEHGRRLQEEERWRRTASTEDARRREDTVAQYANSLRYWEKCREETPEGFENDSERVSPEDILHNIEFFREGLKHIEAGSYQIWIADHVAANRVKLFDGLQPDPTGRHRFKASA